MRDGTLHVGPSFETPEEAEAWVAHFRRAATSAEKTGKAITLDDAMDIVREDMRADGASAATIRFGEEKFKALCCGWAGATAMHRIGSTQVRAYMKHRREEDGCGNVTIRGDLVQLKRLFAVAMREDRLHESPFDKKRIRMPKVDSRRFDHLEPGDIDAMLAAIRAVASQRQKAAWAADVIEFLWLTGIRRTELARLRTDAIDLFRGSLTIQGKTGHRKLPMVAKTKEVAARLVSAAGEDGFLVPSPMGTEVHRAGVVSQVFARWKTRLTIQNHGAAHTMRHSWATHMARNGVSVMDLMLLGGWSSPTQVARYYHGTESHLRAALEAVTTKAAEVAKTGT